MTIRRSQPAAFIFASAVSLLTPALGAQGQPPGNPHAPPPPDPALLQSPVEGPRPPQAAPNPSDEKPPALTRLDLALAFIRFERAFSEARPTGEDLVRANRVFDNATFAFFRGGRGRALHDLNAETLRMMHAPDAEISGAARRAASLRVRVEPPVWVYYTDPAPAVVVRAHEQEPGAGTVPEAPARADSPAAGSLAVRIEPVTQNPAALGADPDAPGAGVGVQLNLPDDAGANGAPTRLDLAPSIRALKPGRYRVVLVGAGGFRWESGWFTVATAPRDAVRASLERRLEAFENARPRPLPHRDADRVAVLRARLALLRDRPSEQSVSGFLTDVNRLEDELLADLAALERDEEPLKGRAGLVFAPFRSGGVTVPTWTYVPEAALAAGSPAPLLVALHGAGAEESMFIAGYGEGVIRALADRHNLIVASPLAYAFTTNPAMLDDLIAAMASRYNVDERRVYLVGHSMGGIAASGLAQARVDKVAAAAAIAGVRPFRSDEPSAPVLAYAAENDRIIPAARVRRLAEEARAAGLPVELREAADQGHTLVVGAVLEECIRWLLKHQRPAP